MLWVDKVRACVCVCVCGLHQKEKARLDACARFVSRCLRSLPITDTHATTNIEKKQYRPTRLDRLVLHTDLGASLQKLVSFHYCACKERRRGERARSHR
jgi:hypothetical protein